MIQTIIDLMIGKAGRSILDVYGNYHVYINTIVIIYGLGLVWAHANLRRMVHRMERMMVEQVKLAGDSPDAEQVHAAFVRSWQVENGGERVLIPSRNDLWFEVVDKGKLTDVLIIHPDYLRVVMYRASNPNPTGNAPMKHYKVWKSYRRQLLSGMRARQMEPETQMMLRNEKASSPKS